MSVLSNPNLWVQSAVTPPVAWQANFADERFWFKTGTEANIEFIKDPVPSSLLFGWEIYTAPAVNPFVFEYNSATGEKSIALGAVKASGHFTITDPSTTDFWFRVVNTVGNTIDSGVVAIGDPAVSFNCQCEDNNNGRTLLSLRTDLMRRLGYSAQAANPPPGMADLITQFLTDAQRQLYRRYEAFRTERIYRWNMTPGIRFYDLEANDDSCAKLLDPYKVTWVGVEDINGSWYPLIEGIRPEFYTALPNTGRPTRYEIRQCIEVFPAPNEADVLRIKGHFGLEAFAADTDKTTIDSDIVFLHALANAKSHYKQVDARNIFAQLDSVLGALVAGSHGTARYIPNAAPDAPRTKPRMVEFDS